MCERVRSSVLGEVVTAVGAVGSVAASRGGRVGLAVSVLGVAAWLWPLVVGVGVGVLSGVFAMGYMLGAFRERPLWVARQHAESLQPAEPDPYEQIAELTRQVSEARAVARAAALELRELGAARSSGDALMWMPPESRRVLAGYADRKEEG